MSVSNVIMPKWLNLANRLAGDAVNHVEVVVKDKFLPKQYVNRHEIVHDLETALWCGPAAISALTGATTSQVRKYVRMYRKDQESRVQGTNEDEVEFVFRKLGYKMELRYLCSSADKKNHPTMARWLRESKRDPHIGYLIGQGGNPGHWVVVHGAFYCCSITDGWVPVQKAPTRRKRVDVVFTVTKLP